MLVDLPNYKADEGKVVPHYVVVDENNKPVLAEPIYNIKPNLENNETSITGKVEKGIFRTDEKFVKLNLETNDLENGEYWLKLKLSEPKEVIRIFKDRPESTENEIVLRGKVEKEKFKNDQIGNISAKGLDNGTYWTKLNITSKKFVVPEKDAQPKKTNKQILLFGEVKEGYFKSYIYTCEAKKDDGKYWLLIEVDSENPTLERASNEKPTVSERNLIVEGSINDEGVFVSEVDSDHKFKTDQKPGKYWFVFEILNGNNLTEYRAIENPKPQLQERQTLVEGNVWIDKYTGEIKFDPKKNRDDHRHHAIDALVIALSKQRYFQQLSLYNAARDSKKKGNRFEKDQLDFPEPWDGFHSDAKREAERLLVSHKQNIKVLTEVRKKIKKNGKTFTSVGDAVRGQLHKENVYGHRQAPYETTKGYHIRKNVTELKDNQLDKIVDLEIRKIIINARKQETILKKQIDSIEKQKKKARTDSEEIELNQNILELRQKIEMLYTLKNKNGEPVPIKKVRIREEMSNAQPLKGDLHWVNPRNNHHVLIYEDENGKWKEDIQSFWEVVERQKQGQERYQLPQSDETGKILFTLQENDMYILGVSSEVFDEFIGNQNDLTKYLYRVQKISKMNIMFRHHLASTLNDKNQEIHVQSLGRLIELNPIKVRISSTGKIEKF